MKKMMMKKNSVIVATIGLVLCASLCATQVTPLATAKATVTIVEAFKLDPISNQTIGTPLAWVERLVLKGGNRKGK